MKHRRRGRIVFLTVAGILSVILAVFWWFITLIFDESRDIHRYSLAYWILVPDVIHRLPLDHCIGPPHYHYSAGDGPKPLIVTRRCQTSDQSAATAYYRTLLLEWGYRVSDQDDYLRQNDHALELSTRVPDRFEIIYLW